MMEIVFRPIDNWPHKAATRKRSLFKAGYGDTMTLLRSELRQLKARNVVIQLDLTERDIRLDGLPRSDARPATPRVIVAFESRYGPLKYYADTYDNWSANLRAVAMSLECLRAVDRYGITRRGEQYTGWKQLPGAVLPAPSMTAEEAATVIAKWGEATAAEIIKSPQARRAAYRQACKRTHPDSGGKNDDFLLVQKAMEVLEKVSA